MPAKHSVYDSDSHFIIDPITRSMACNSKKIQLMQHDHNSERFTFEIPRYVEGHDMLECDVQIHYINAGTGAEQNADVYLVDDMQISPLSETMITGSWLISGKATKYAGTLNFVVRFVCFKDANIEYQWFTDIYTGIKIVQSIYNSDISESDEYQNPDLIESWKREILSSIVVNVDSTTKAAQAAEKSAQQATKSATIAATNANNAMTAASLAGETAKKVLEVSSRITDAENAAKAAEHAATTAENAAKIAENLNGDSIRILGETQATLDEVNKKSSTVSFFLNFLTGELEYESADYKFHINEETGNLEWEVA